MPRRAIALPPPPPLEVKGKSKSQSTIMTFLAGGAQDSSSAHTTLPSEINKSVIETILLGTSSKKMCIENNEPLIKATQGSEDSLGTEDSNRITREKELAPPAGNKQPQAQPQAQQPEHQIREGTVSASGSALDSEDLHKISGNPKGWNKATGKDPKSVDWGKDSSDKFYSLTEESDLSSGDHSFGESDSSETSEAGNKSSSNEPTVRQLRRQRKSAKSQPCSQEDFENSTSTGGRTLKWDYSGIGLTDTPTTNNQGSVNNNMEGGTGGPASNLCVTGTEAGMLQSIYSSIKELQTETRIESRHARVATKRLQGTVRKVAKSCTEIGAKLWLMEERIGAVEEDVDALKEQSATRDDQMTDVMWKLEDFENQQRINNLRFLGIPEGLEGSNIQTYMVKLLRGAFPELGNWDWENELQRTIGGFPKKLRANNVEIIQWPDKYQKSTEETPKVLMCEQDAEVGLERTIPQ
ncbi:hypothetical protein NDU88_011434 [Pleurodeles waltl]|uniref:Uncharacterized protein n=1 Tax=Pleurodeles waltl TaxID=8319 RepID=A0AAV7PXR2_PLEWA|nr:hypothetical protein NDU88_011434 [Pleurodeles waltl]